MAKNTKSKLVKTEKVSKHWFSERNHGKAEIFAKRIPKDSTEAKVEVKTGNNKVRNIDIVKQVLTEAKVRISIDDAVKKFLDIHPMRSKKPEIAAKTAFLQATSHGVPVKIEKDDKTTYIQLA